MPTRSQLFNSICSLVGTHLCVPVYAGAGWPGIADVLTASGATVRAAMHVSVVGSHSRAAYEMRFQNPSNRAPVSTPGGAVPILIGLAYVGLQPILVAVDGTSRVGRSARFSILFRDDILKNAATDGWAEYLSSTGERIFAFHPKLLGIFVDGLSAGVFPEAQDIAQASAASGVVQDNTDAAANRVRAVGSRLVRDARFGRDVKAAYQGRCAMCGLSLGLVVGAHIFPVEAPKSPDKVWNGMALCHNHHGAFDKHFIWVDPSSHAIKLRSDILDIAVTDAAAKTFTDNTRKSILVPAAASNQPRSAMFTQRYDFYEEHYAWA